MSSGDRTFTASFTSLSALRSDGQGDPVSAVPTHPFSRFFSKPTASRLLRAKRYWYPYVLCVKVFK